MLQMDESSLAQLGADYSSLPADLQRQLNTGNGQNWSYADLTWEDQVGSGSGPMKSHHTQSGADSGGTQELTVTHGGPEVLFCGTDKRRRGRLRDIGQGVGSLSHELALLQHPGTQQMCRRRRLSKSLSFPLHLRFCV
jgi:hypothetical protein